MKGADTTDLQAENHAEHIAETGELIYNKNSYVQELKHEKAQWKRRFRLSCQTVSDRKERFDMHGKGVKIKEFVEVFDLEVLNEGVDYEIQVISAYFLLTF